MSGHEQFAEDLALYALGAMEGNERAVLEQHLAGCPGCRLELEQLRGDGALLSLAAAGAQPPLRARQRLLDAIAREPKSVAGSSASPREVISRETNDRSAATRPRSWWGVLGWAAAVAVLVFAASLWKENESLKREVRNSRGIIGQQTLQLDAAQKFVDTMTNPAGQHFTLVAAKAPPQPQGKAFYLKNRRSLVFLATNMPQLPPQKAYELWLIPVQGKPIPAGVFKPDARGSATLTNPPLPPGTEAKAFAITVENEAGAEAPTSPIIMMGAGE
ncbi:MAG TPA: anti-sigma factor [Candidatus Sulfotelmatobacter sp.]